MVESTFTNVTLEKVRSILPKKTLLPHWTKFTVYISIPERGDASITLFDRYYFSVSQKKAFKAMAALSQ